MVLVIPRSSSLALGRFLVALFVAGIAGTMGADARAQCPPDFLFLPLTTGVADPAVLNPLPAGTPDSLWSVRVDPSGDPVPRAATVVDPSSPGWPATWAPAQEGAWISADLRGPAGTYEYTTCFCLLPGFLNPRITLNIRADDEAEVFLNGVSVGQTGPGTANQGAAPASLIIQDPAAFQDGQNCLTIRVGNGSGVATGLYVSGSLQAQGGQCCAFFAGSIHGHKYHDQDGDGMQGPAEPGLEGWEIVLTDSNGNPTTTFTNQFGEYWFMDVPPGDYTVDEVAQDGWTQTQPAPGPYQVSLQQGQVVQSLDFGNWAATTEDSVCCNNAPAYTDTAYAGFTGQVIAATCWADTNSTSDQDYALAVIDVKDRATAPFGSPNNWLAPKYHGPAGGEWTIGRLGGVFGLDLDSRGNIYVTHTACYALDNLGIGGQGAVYQVDAITGLVSTFATLPNQFDATLFQYSGLGNIAYDCKHDQFFVTNFEDGKIYRLDNSGGTASTFDHGAPENGLAGFEPRGELLWGVGVFQDRVYYAVYWEDLQSNSGTVANQVWSIGLDALGDFTGAATLEFDLPPLSGQDWSNPVADIEFSIDGKMMLAERSMINPGQTYAHASRVLEYVQTTSGWVPSTNTFQIGNPTYAPSSSGGVDYDVCGGVWAMSDAINYPTPGIYGVQMLDGSGGTVFDSYVIDLDENTTSWGDDKTRLGDVDAICMTAICGTKYDDQNASASRDPSEPGLAGWSINLTGSTSGSALTDALGRYSFMPVAPGGSFTVSEIVQAGWVPVNPPGGTQGVTFTAADVVQFVDFGNTMADTTCCDNQPAYADTAFANEFLGRMAAATCFAWDPNDPVLAMIDTDDRAAATVGSNWLAPSYHGPPGNMWTKGLLGTVFGLAFDGVGNLYVTASSAYNSDSYPNGPGAVYRVDASTGIASVWATLPNLNSLNRPSLGNIAYDCEHDQLFVTNHEDGRIYRMNTAGAVLGTFDHDTGTIAIGLTSETGEPDGSFVPLGERVWAVGVHDNRVYYSVWWDNVTNPNTLQDNEIHSIALDGTGNFTGSSSLEITLPTRNSFVDYSSPVADIAFSENGLMMLGERSMRSNTSVSAHIARLLEYELVGTTWVPSGNNPFNIGDPGSSLEPSASGGVDYEPCDAVLATGDALTFGTGNYCYGFQIMDPLGGNSPSSYVVDLDADLVSQDKTLLGDIESPFMSSVCAVKYDDLNANGMRDPGEPGLAGWTFDLFGSSVVSDSTDAFGHVAFTPALPGAYVLSEQAQSGWTPTSPPGGEIDLELAPCEVILIEFGNTTAVDSVCCDNQPAYEDTAYASFTGQVSVVTCFTADPADYVVAVFDAKDKNTQTLNTNWPASAYHGPTGNQWTRASLGTVFGLDLDSVGNILVTSTTSYSDDFFPGSPGDIWLLSGTTGTPSLFTTLPNTGPALGNIAYDWEFDQHFATNFEDGRIYRIGSSGTILETFDPGLPDGGGAGFAPLGERVWGVGVYEGRVYYAFWSEDQGRPSGSLANEIWSIGLLPSGGFDFGSDILEVTLPVYAANWSNPVSDIAFSSGKMLLAERTMNTDTLPGAHNARLLEYSGSSGSWAPSGSTFDIGIFPPQTNAAGGAAYQTDQSVWATGDALHIAAGDRIYGLQILPELGGDITSSFLLDLNGDLVQAEKTEIGDVELPCLTSICGTKFHDLDGDGVKDPDEPGLPGWTINLSGTQTGTTVTDEHGNYCFAPLRAGNYQVTEALQSGWTQTYPVGGSHSVILTQGSFAADLDFGNAEEDSICCVPAPKGLCAWYPGDVDANAVDLVAPPAPGGLVNATGYAAGEVGTAFEFPGPLDIVSVPHNGKLTFLNQMSIDLWVRTRDSVSVGAQLVDKLAPGGPFGIGYRIQLDAGRPAFSVGDGVGGDAQSLPSPNVADNLWHHLALTVSAAGQIEFYVDGASVYSNTVAPLSVIGTGAIPMRFGFEFSGQLDEIQLFRRALTAAEVQSLFRAGSAGKCRETCFTTLVKPCKIKKNGAIKDGEISVTLCNYTTTVQNYNWNLNNLPVGPGCDVTGLTFSPSAGFISVNPGECVVLGPISVTCPPMMQPGTTACYEFVVSHEGQHPDTCAIRCDGTVRATDLKWNVDAVPIDVIGFDPGDSVSNPIVLQFDVENLNDPTGLFEYEIHVVPSDGDTSLPSASLDGRPAGQPVVGSVQVQPGAIAPVMVDFQQDYCDGLNGQHVAVHWDTDGDGTKEAAFSIMLIPGVTPRVVAVDPEPVRPVPAGLVRAMPNPFRSGTQLVFSLETQQTVEIDVFDVAGRRVRTLRPGLLEAGEVRVAWNGKDDRGASLATGIYLVHVRAGDRTMTAKIVMIQ